MSNWKRRQNLSVEFNFDLMDNDTKSNLRRFKPN